MVRQMRAMPVFVKLVDPKLKKKIKLIVSQPITDVDINNRLFDNVISVNCCVTLSSLMYVLLLSSSLLLLILFILL